MENEERIERGKTIIVDMAYQHLSDIQKPVTKKDLNKAYDGIIHAMREILRQDDIVRLGGIGRLCPSVTYNKKGYDFKEKREVTIPKITRVYFKASQSFKDYIKMSDDEYMEYKVNLIRDLLKDDEITEIGYVADILD